MKQDGSRLPLSIKEITLIAVFTAITAVLAQIAIPLPFTPIPISLGIVAVYISGLLLKPKHAVCSQLCYLALGAVGVPVFVGFMGGISALFGPTGGFLMAYPLMAAAISYTVNGAKSLQTEPTRSRLRLYIKTGIAVTAALCFAYLAGALWLSVTTGSSVYISLTLVCFPFIPLDIAKIVFTVFVMLPLRARLMRANLLQLY